MMSARLCAESSGHADASPSLLGGDGHGSRAILALDAGQTGTQAALGRTTCSSGGSPEGAADGAGIQLPGVLTDRPLVPQLEQIVRRALDEAVPAAGTVEEVALGVSGLTSADADASALLARLADTGLRRLHLAHDSVTSALGALGAERGVVVAAGTGAVTLAVGVESVARVDGWGNIMGDAGSAWWIGRRGLEAAMRAHDGRGPATALESAARSRWPDLESAYIALQHDPDRVRVVAAFAREVTRLAAEDAEAAAICREAGAELAHAAIVALRRAEEPRAEEPVQVACLGGVFRARPVHEAFLEALTAQVGAPRLLSADHQGVDGATMMAALDAEHPLRTLVSRAEASTVGREAARLLRVENTPRPYAWGEPGGISRLCGRPAYGLGPEAELWLGAHPVSPTRTAEKAPWTDLVEWELRTGRSLPFLFKLLTAAEPLSLQVHPSAEQADRGFRREEAAGVPRDAARRSYRDPRAKPEMLLALEDGFEALCGFRPVEETRAVLDAAADCVARRRGTASDAVVGLRRWRRLLDDQGPAACLQWLLDAGECSGEAIGELLVAAACDAADTDVPADSASESFAVEAELIRRLQGHHPGDPGVAASVMLNHLVLAAGESLWLPAGTIHAYLAGVGAELMAPSDNVLRGGLTRKHVDVPELLAVLEDTAAPVRPLSPEHPTPTVVVHRPPTTEDGADFQLTEITGDASLSVPGPALGAVLEGEFTIAVARGERQFRRGELLWLTATAEMTIRGAGRLLVAMPQT